MSSAGPGNTETGNSDPEYTKLKTKNLPWYSENAEMHLTSEIRKQLEEYSGIPPDQVVGHIRDIREKLWDIRAYPCTGLFVFLIPWIKKHSAWATILTHLKDTPNAQVLDVGTYIAHDLRALHFAGVPTSALNGVDLVKFWDLGFEFFRDSDRFSAQFCLGDILDSSEDSEEAKLFDGKMDVVWCSAVLHQFNWDRQVQASKRLVRFAKKGAEALVVGCGVGSKDESGHHDVEQLTGGKAKSNDPFKHNVNSMKKMWKTVGDELGLELEVDAKWACWEDYGCSDEACRIMGPDVGVLEFTVKVP